MSATAAKRQRRAEERALGLRRPLVLAATRGALDDTARLLPPRTIVETEIAAAIERGRVKASANGRYVVALTRNVEAVCVRERSRLTGRRAWRPLMLRRART